jgi:hypothetical protein
MYDTPYGAICREKAIIAPYVGNLRINKKLSTIY